MTSQKAFPGYYFVPAHKSEDGLKHNMYRGIDVGFGGYILSNPGAYGRVAMLDSASHHPHSAIIMNAFGDYTKNFEDILNARIAIKHKEFDKAKEMFDGRLAKYLDDPTQAKQLAQALKIVVNSTYGMTAASFDNPFRDPRNENNIIALRGALFMKNLQDEVELRGFRIPAIKTDSIKIADATPEIIKFVQEYGREYGYEFEHECTYDRCVIANDADYIAKYATKEECEEWYGYCPGDNFEHGGQWTATGKKFQHPYVFKSVFTKEPIEFSDLCETKEVKSAIYLDMGTEDNPDRHFIGKVGSFCPIKEENGGGRLVRDAGTKFDSVTGTKNYRWLEAEIVQTLNKEKDIDMDYFHALADDAIGTVCLYTDYQWFISGDKYIPPEYADGKFGRYPIYKDEIPFYTSDNPDDLADHEYPKED